MYNYYRTVQKSTNVTHACVCNFSTSTDCNDLHLILGKSNHLEICQYSEGVFKTISDLPIFGRIATLEPFRRQDETRDLLFITTQELKFCVLEWNNVTPKLDIRNKGDISKAEFNVGRRIDNTQLCAIDPDCAVIVIHLYDGLFQVIRFHDIDTYPFAAYRFKVHKVLDLKFLFGCSKPTIAVLFQDMNDVHHFKTYELSLNGTTFVEGPLSRANLHYTAQLLIPVPSPVCGILIIGEENIVYCSANDPQTISFEHSAITKAYGRDRRGLNYLLGDHTGTLRLLAITYNEEKVGLKLNDIGKTSIPSTISFLNDETVYIGSSYGDSQISYLLCGLANGNLAYFRLDAYSLTEEKMVYLGTEEPLVLQPFSYNKTPHILAVCSDRPILISRSGEDFHFSYTDMKELLYMCPVNFPAYQNMLAFGKKEDDLTIGTIGHTHNLHIHQFISLGEQPLKICHQQSSKTFGILTSKLCDDKSESHFVKFLEVRTFKVLLSFSLQKFEHGRFITSCPFSDDEVVYYCIGTAFVFCNENESSKGRILVFASRGGSVVELVSKTETKGAVNCLSQFMNGKLFATVGRSIQVYKTDDLRYGLQSECENKTNIVPLCVQTREHGILVGDVMESMSLFRYMVTKSEGASIVKLKRCEKKKGRPVAHWMSAFEFLNSFNGNEVYLGVTADFKLVTILNIAGSHTALNVGSEYYTGEFISKFQQGYVAPPMVRSEAVDVSPMLTFGTFNGVIGVIAPLSQKQFDLLKKVEEVAVATCGDVVGLCHEEWRRLNSQEGISKYKYFLDVDILELYHGLEESERIEIAGRLGVFLDYLREQVIKFFLEV